MNETIARLVGMQTAKARRVTAEQTHHMLEVVGRFDRLRYDGEYTIVASDIRIVFHARSVDIDHWQLDGHLCLRHDTTPTVLFSVIDGLRTVADEIVESIRDEDADFLDWEDPQEPEQLHHCDPAGEVTWTKATAPPMCCHTAMTEREPYVVWGTCSVYAERVFSCPSCDSYRHIEVTDPDEALQLCVEVSHHA